MLVNSFFKILVVKVNTVRVNGLYDMLEMLLEKVSNIEKMLTNGDKCPTTNETEAMVVTPNVATIKEARRKEPRSSPNDYNRVVLITSSDEEVIRNKPKRKLKRGSYTSPKQPAVASMRKKMLMTKVKRELEDEGTSKSPTHKKFVLSAEARAALVGKKLNFSNACSNKDEGNLPTALGKFRMQVPSESGSTSYNLSKPIVSKVTSLLNIFPVLMVLELITNMVHIIFFIQFVKTLFEPTPAMNLSTEEINIALYVFHPSKNKEYIYLPNKLSRCIIFFFTLHIIF